MRKVKHFILPPFIPCLMLFLVLFRPAFLTYIIFPLSKELDLTILARQV